MAIIFDEPKYPVIDSDPSLWKIIKNFRLSDYGVWGAVAASGFPYGYYAGYKTPLIARSSMWFGGYLGTLAGFMLAIQNSHGRLLGFNENAVEVAKYK